MILNGLQFDDLGGYSPRRRPFPGSNLFSLASGGAIYIRDPEHKTVGEQLNGGHFHTVTAADRALIKPYLVENEKLLTTSRLTTCCRTTARSSNPQRSTARSAR